MRRFSTMMFLVFCLMDAAAFAQTPPVDNSPTLCSVRGVVQPLKQEEFDSPTLKKRVLVPVVVLDIAAMVPEDANYKGVFCDQVAPAPAVGGKRFGYFRLCDPVAEFMAGQTITGVVGLSQAGGRYCIAKIQVQPPE